MKTNASSNILCEESFDIENPEVTIATISSDVSVLESVDGQCKVVVSGKSMSQDMLAEFVEITSSGRNLSIRVDKGGRGLRGLFTGGTGHFSVVVSLPKTSELKITTVSADVEVETTLNALTISAISGDISVLRNPTGPCILKTVSGDITTHTYSRCQYSINSVSGDIKVHVAPGLGVDVDGKSISGDLESEISLSASDDASSQNDDIVKISTSTISGDFTLARN
jgi:hypothetical protein